MCAIEGLPPINVSNLSIPKRVLRHTEGMGKLEAKQQQVLVPIPVTSEETDSVGQVDSAILIHV